VQEFSSDRHQITFGNARKENDAIVGSSGRQIGLVEKGD
jgi:hypothetical protein